MTPPALPETVPGFGLDARHMHGQPPAGGPNGSSHGPPHLVEVPFFGYNSRVFPCLNDTATCDYLTALYVGHIEGMLFTGLIWVTFILIFVAWAFLRCVGRPKSPPPPGVPRRSGAANTAPATVRLRRTLGAFFRRRLLQQAARPIFGRATRLQVLVLAMLSVYLTLWSFIGIIYGKWKSPVEGRPDLFNTRTSLAPWADRVGVFAYALTPFLILLGSRESLLSLMSGVPYRSFNFLHRWVGYIVFAQSLLHTIGWTVIEVGLYQPQPQTARDWIKQKYMIGGCAAMGLLTLMVALSTTWGIRLTGYEFFRKSHYLLAIAYFAACVVHWHKLEVFMAPSLILWVADRAIRLVRSAVIHFGRLPSGRLGFQAAQATISRFPDGERGDVIRLDFENHQKAWPVGKHFYLCFSELSIWQSHPFTPLNAPTVRDGMVRHSYIMRVKSGATLQLAKLAEKKHEALGDSSDGGIGRVTASVIATGPYGEDFLRNMTTDTNVMCIAGGTGVTGVLSVLLDLAQQTPQPDRRIEFIWAMRHADDAGWVQEELDILRKAPGAQNITVRLYATRDVFESTSSIDEPDEKKGRDVVGLEEVASSSSREVLAPCGSQPEMTVRRTAFGGEEERDRRPDLGRLVNDFVASTVRGPTTVFASGPGGMLCDLRTIVAAHNDASRVWRNEERYSVRLVSDDRPET